MWFVTIVEVSTRDGTLEKAAQQEARCFLAMTAMRTSPKPVGPI